MLGALALRLRRGQPGSGRVRRPRARRRQADPRPPLLRRRMDAVAELAPRDHAAGRATDGAGPRSGPGCTIDVMTHDVTVILDDRPGELARLGEVAGAAGVNIEGFGVHREGKGAWPMCSWTTRALKTSTMRSMRQAWASPTHARCSSSSTVADEPGALGEVTRRLADSNVNIDLATPHSPRPAAFGWSSAPTTCSTPVRRWNPEARHRLVTLGTSIRVAARSRAVAKLVIAVNDRR